jgi:myo-inositol 2-dehydrogenase/D-chiro-inositol 1-dehydrogenase
MGIEIEHREGVSAMKTTGKLGRREFMGAAATAGFMIVNPGVVRGTAANSAVRVGLLGCGGRGTEDASNLVDTGQARVVALADLFQDQLDKAKDHFDQLARSKGQSGVDPRQMFRGPRAFEAIANSKEVDAIVLTTPPYFHPQHLEAVVAAGKHVYCEKPVAVDVVGAKRVIEIGKKAQGKVSLEVGFQIRKAPPFVELVRRVHAGALGRIACGEAYYYGTFIKRPEWPGASPAERRLRNWVYDRILSGDIIVEQNIHAIDVCNWLLDTHPIKAVATGARTVRPDPGDVYGNYSVVFYYPNDVSLSFSSTQFDKGWWDVNERFFGSKGVCESHYSGPVAIYGDEAWSWDTGPSPQKAESKQFSATGKFSDNLADADPEKKKSFVESITSGKFHNQAEQGAIAALSCMMARESAYSGQPITWDELLNSDLEWDSALDLNQFA